MRSGLLFGAGAYGMWGLFPAFFPLLKPAGAVEVLAHRIIWSFVLMVVVVTAVRRLGDLRQITGRVWLLLTAAAALISVNWLIYVYTRSTTATSSTRRSATSSTRWCRSRWG